LSGAADIDRFTGQLEYNRSVNPTQRHAVRQVPVRAIVVEVESGVDAGQRVAGDDVAIGTAEGSTLRLTDPLVSRFHCELQAGPHGIAIVDHGSTNGTYVGSVRVERATIAPGTQLRIGNTVLRVDDAAPVQVEMHGGDALGGIIGGSPVMRRLLARVAKVAQSDVSVLVTGESGTGKELVARALHDLGPRANGPFVTVDCGSLPPTLIASELFGHERGAFTGADRQHIGEFEAAHRGTLFLDEIGELQPSVQATLLGVLERRRVRRLGGRSEVPVDVRVVAATHRDLRAEVNSGSFRLDLFYRLAVVTLAIPPLRERAEDIPLLVEHFLRDAGSDQPVAALISPKTMEALSRHHFAGNVRELRNLVEAAVAMGEAPTLGESDHAQAPANASFATDLALPYKEARAQLLADFEAHYVDNLLQRASGNVSAAARLGQMTRSHLNELLAKRKT